MSALPGDMLSSGGGTGGYMAGPRSIDGRGDARADSKDEVRTQFITREGAYRLLPTSEYARPNRVQSTGSNNTPVRVSFIKTPHLGSGQGSKTVGGTLTNSGGPGAIGSPPGLNGGNNLVNGGIYMGWGGANVGSNGPCPGEYGGSGWQAGYANDTSSNNWPGGIQNSWNGTGMLNSAGSSSWNGNSGLNGESCSEEKICFNVGKELYVYNYNGVHKAVDLTRPIDKRLYRGTSPTCHDFNPVTCRSDRALLVIGFTAGQVQLIDPIGKEISRLYNEERHIDKTRVTCIRWLPESPNQFLVSHLSGQLYVYDEDLPCGATPPTYQLFKAGDGFSVHTCKTRSTRNPLYRWLIDGSPAINEFAFSPCSRYLAVACGDGFLRIFDYNRMELVGTMKSYFGGLLCVAWSPDGKYLVTGGEDDLVTIWSFAEKRVVCRGRGHTSWVNVVSFDPYTTSVAASGDAGEQNLKVSEEGDVSKTAASAKNCVDRSSKSSVGAEQSFSSYRFGSVGQDTVLCLWDLTEDVLKQPAASGRGQKTGIVVSSPSGNVAANASSSGISSNHLHHVDATDRNSRHDNSNCSSTASSVSSLSRKYGTLSLNNSEETSTKHHKHSNSMSSSSKSAKSMSSSLNAKLTAAVASAARLNEAALLLGTMSCPGLLEVPLLEPLTCKKIAHERLTSLMFRKDCFITACQEGNVYTWLRPIAWTAGGRSTADHEVATGS